MYAHNFITTVLDSNKKPGPYIIHGFAKNFLNFLVFERFKFATLGQVKKYDLGTSVKSIPMQCHSYFGKFEPSTSAIKE